MYQQIVDALKEASSPEKKAFLLYFFKTGKGEYAEGDLFLGVTVPVIRSIAKEYLGASLSTLHALLQSPYHECRFCALVLLIHQFRKAPLEAREPFFRFYLEHTNRINNWDLVDVSAPAIVGEYLFDQPRTLLYELAASTNLWEQRIAMVATLYFIRHYQLDDTFKLARLLLHHPHDLMHKAVGWMLREAGKKELEPLVVFLEKYAAEMPRTMLRYAIEKMDADQRLYFRSKKKG